MRTLSASQYVCPRCAWRTVYQGQVKGAGRGIRDRKCRADTVSPPLKKLPLSRQFQTHAIRPILPSRLRANERTISDPTQTDVSDPLEAETLSRGYDSLGEEKVLALIDEGEPLRLSHAFQSPEYGPVFSRLPAAIFSEALRLLSPAYFVEPFKEIQARLHLRHASRDVAPLRQTFKEFGRRLNEIVTARRLVGHNIGLAEYTHLLDCAAAMGDARMADSVWMQMKDDGVEPSVECFNHYMEAKAWYNTHFVRENHRVAATAHTYKRRMHRNRSLDYGYSGYGTGPGGTRDQVYHLLNEMLDKGLEPDTTTYTHVMVASSREWDLKAVMQILKDVWNVDTEMLAQNPEGHPPVTQYPTSSPLHPTYDLLYAVAHVFCTNKKFPVAVQLVDFISRSYGMRIPDKAWHELFNWAFQIASRRFRADTRKEDRASGSLLPAKTVVDTYDTMASDTYNVDSLMRTHDTLVKTEWYRQVWDEFLNNFRAGVNMFTETLSKRNQLKDELDSLLPECVSPSADKRALQLTNVNLGECEYLIPSSTSDAHYWHTFYEFHAQHMKTLCEAHFLKRWGSLTFSRQRWTCRFDWERRLVPNAIKEFQLYLPVSVYYRTTSGRVVMYPESASPTDERPLDSLTRLIRSPDKQFKCEDPGQQSGRLHAA